MNLNETNKNALFGALVESDANEPTRAAAALAAIPWSLVAIACAVAVALIF